MKKTLFIPKIRSRHDSHDVIRGKLPAFPFRTIVRLGSNTKLEEVFPKLKPGRKVVEINSVDGIKVSSNKLLMKEAFTKAAVKTADWWGGSLIVGTGKILFYKCANDFDNEDTSIEKLPYPIVAKHIYGSRGTGNYLLENEKALTEWLKGKDLAKYIFEAYYSFNREYRLHVSKNGVFYTNRKMLKSDTPHEKRWFRNDSNSNWIKEDNPLFDKPTNWDTIVGECVKALDAVGLDVAAFDVRVQSAKDSKEQVRTNPDFIVIESNSAPSFGEITSQKYMEELPKIITQKS